MICDDSYLSILCVILHLMHSPKLAKYPEIDNSQCTSIVQLSKLSINREKAIKCICFEHVWWKILILSYFTFAFWIPVNFNGKLHQCNSSDILLTLISGLIALIFSCWSKATLARDWDGALLRGKIAFGFAVCGIVITVVAVLGFVLIFYTRDT